MSLPNYSQASYNSLGAYNSFGTQQAMGIHPPVPAGTPSMAIQVVPVYGMPGYEALTHGGLSQGEGHFTITNAYPNYSSNCTKFASRLCAGKLDSSGAAAAQPAPSRYYPAPLTENYGSCRRR